MTSIGAPAGTGICPVMWPVGIVRGAWVNQPCGQPTEPGQRHCADCLAYAEQERSQR